MSVNASDGEGRGEESGSEGVGVIGDDDVWAVVEREEERTGKRGTEGRRARGSEGRSGGVCGGVGSR